MAVASAGACGGRAAGWQRAKRVREVRGARRAGRVAGGVPQRVMDSRVMRATESGVGGGQGEEAGEEDDEGPVEVFRIEQLVDGEAEQVAAQKGAATGLLLVGGACVSLTAFLFARSFLGESGGANALNEAGLPLAIIWAVGGAVALGLISNAGVLEGDR